MPYLLTSLLILLLGFPSALLEAAIVNTLWAAYVILAHKIETKPKTRNSRTWKSTYAH